MCPIPGRVRDQAGWGSKQFGLVEVVPAYGTGLELDNL